MKFSLSTWLKRMILVGWQLISGEAEYVNSVIEVQRQLVAGKITKGREKMMKHLVIFAFLLVLALCAPEEKRKDPEIEVRRIDDDRKQEERSAEDLLTDEKDPDEKDMGEEDPDEKDADEMDEKRSPVSHPRSRAEPDEDFNYYSDYRGLTGNLAKGKPTLQSTTAYSGGASRAVDGITFTDYFRGSCTHTKHESRPWWRVDLQSYQEVVDVKLTNRGDCCSNRLQHIEIIVGNVDKPTYSDYGNQLCTYHQGAFAKGATTTLACKRPIYGRYVYVVKTTTGYLTLCEVQVYGVEGAGIAIPHSEALTGNIAQGKSTQQSSTYSHGVSSRAVDGKTYTNYFRGGGSCTHTNYENKPWWRVDLGSVQLVKKVVITNRGDCCSKRLNHVQVSVGNIDSKPFQNPICAYFQGPVGSGATHTFTCSSPKLGRYVFVALRVKQYLTLCEVKVYALKHGLRRKDETENQAERGIEVDEAKEMDSGEDDELEADLDEEDYDSQYDADPRPCGRRRCNKLPRFHNPRRRRAG